MALRRDERRRLLALDLPSDRAMREEIHKYLDRSGLALGDFARRVGYSTVSLKFFMTGKYENVAGTSVSLRAAAREFMDAHPVGQAVNITGALYETENVRTLRKYFYAALEHKGRACCIEGMPGTQKTHVLEYLVAELNRRELSSNGAGRRAYSIDCMRKITRLGLLKEVAMACGSPSAGDCARIVRNLRFDFAGRDVLLIFDEAQQLDIDCIETLRALCNRPPYFSMLFAGSHQLTRLFVLPSGEARPELEQWNSRVLSNEILPGLSREEVSAIARGELGADYPDRKIEALIAKSKVKATSSQGIREYISARKVFDTVGEIRGRRQKNELAKGAGA